MTTRPRFYIGSLTGYPMDRPHVGRYRNPEILWYVFDRAFCCRPVAQFPNINHGRERAQRHADRLNAE